MKRVLLVVSILIAFSLVLIKSSASFTTDFIYDNNYVTGLFDDNELNKVSIFPNPVIDKKVTITSEKSIVMIEILDVVGSSVFIQRYDLETKKVDLNLEKLNKGLYIVKVKLDSKSTFTEKIMVE